METRRARGLGSSINPSERLRSVAIVTAMHNVDKETVAGFGDEWSRFDQAGVAPDEQKDIFDQYFSIFPWSRVGKDAIGFDAGCGSGRWAALVAPRVKKVHCIDASGEALGVARTNLARFDNVELTEASVQEMPIADGTMDFGYSLGVLHHVPDTRAALAACVRKLKPNAPFLVYLYYAFDNRPLWFRSVWRASDAVRKVVSKLPHGARYLTTQAIAASVYWPLARGARTLERLGVNVENLPLTVYRSRSFYVMRTDALDRFGTRLEQRFTRSEIASMMQDAGLKDIAFREEMPFWTAIGYRAA
jgi:ubiquinone/menaquinone biosynthesis C-methylase UbiE